jgi:germination protein M
LPIIYNRIMSDKKNNRKNTGFAFACWLLIALILLVFFFVKKDTIVLNLKNTDFFNRVFGKTPEFVQKHEDATAPQDNSDSTVVQIDTKPAETAEQQKNEQTQQKPEQAAQPEEPLKVTDQKKPDAAEKLPEAASSDQKTPAADSKSEKSVEKVQKSKPAAEITNTQLCFVIIDSDGSVSRQIVTRHLQKSDSPLSDAIKALLSGPTADEKAKNCMSLIPAGTKLLSANVKNGIATLNFSEEFEYNPVGVEGYIGQLMQIVYTATSFTTVNSVQFIVEGQREEYLGSEGEWIGSPLSRSTFR